MKTRQLKRSDLPKYRRSEKSLHIPVMYEGKKRFVCDINFVHDQLCWLERIEGQKDVSVWDDGNSSVTIADLKLILNPKKGDASKYRPRKKFMKEEFIRSDELAFFRVLGEIWYYACHLGKHRLAERICIRGERTLDELVEYRNNLKVENQKRLEKLKLEN